MSDINLICPAIITQLITLLLFLKSKPHDRYLLFVMIIGQLILISGESDGGVMGGSDKNLNKIQISHIIFTLSIAFGSLYFKESHNLYLIGILILLRFITRFIYEDCLFLMSNSQHRFEIEENFEFINWNIVFFISLMIILYRLLKN
jgi:hypothetical protein